MLRISELAYGKLAEPRREDYVRQLGQRLNLQFPEHFVLTPNDPVEAQARRLLELAERHGFTGQEEIAQFAGLALEAGGEVPFERRLKPHRDLLDRRDLSECVRILSLRHRLEERSAPAVEPPPPGPVGPGEL